MMNRRKIAFGKEYENLIIAGINGGRWIDAGAGRGAYTLPLAQLVDEVLAIDINKGNTNRLKEMIKQLELSNIFVREGDLTDIENYKEKIQGVLFAFSLHYQTDITFLKELLKEKKSKESFKVVIIEYIRIKPVSWVPHPYPPKKLLIELSSMQQKAEIKFRNDRYYILVLE